MTPIGGFLELESLTEQITDFAGKPLRSGRACLSAILNRESPKRVFVPSYLCDAAVRAVSAAGSNVEFYGLDSDLQPLLDPRDVDQDSMVLMVTYFGLSQTLPLSLIRSFRRPIVDNACAFYRSMPGDFWSFNSARKFVGVADGAYLTGPNSAEIDASSNVFGSEEHLRARQLGEPDAHQLYRRAERSFDNSVSAMSDRSRRRMSRADHVKICNRRRRNYESLQEMLGMANRLQIGLDADDVPHYYPFLSSIPIHQRLIQEGILVPSLWSEVITRSPRSPSWEQDLATRLLPLPIDQRYGHVHMERVAAVVREVLDDI